MPVPLASSPKHAKHHHPVRVIIGQAWQRALSLAVGVGRLCTPAARGVYHPQQDSRVVLGVALRDDVDVDALERQLWWRGLGIVERDGHLIAGADITSAVQRRRVRSARTFVTRQLRDAGVRGAVKRWE